jgi:protoporphyrinogen/coproporphyrinogen III oxidase
MNDNNKLPIVIIGAGISGLSAANRLHQRGFDVLVLESLERVGGCMNSVSRDGFLLELGPNSFSRKPATDNLIGELDIEQELYAEPLRMHPRFLFDGKKLVEVPSGPLSLLGTRLISSKAKVKLMREPLRRERPSGDISIADFMRRQVGEEMLEMFVGPFVSGIYEGDPEKMSMPAAFPLIYKFAEAKGSVVRGALAHFRELKRKRKESGEGKRPKRKPSALCSFRNGLAQLPGEISTKLGSKVRCGCEVSKIEVGQDGFRISTADRSEVIEACALVIATPVHEAARLTDGWLPGAHDALTGISQTSMLNVHVGVKLESLKHKPRGFGFLVPRDRGIRALGVLWTSAVFAGRAPSGHTLLTMFYGGATDPAAIGLNDDEIKQIVKEDMKKCMGWDGKHELFNTVRYEKGLPEYNMGILECWEQLRKAQESCALPLRFIGNYHHGISIPDCVRNANDAAEELANSLVMGDSS